jgi:hypothetical protein
MATTLKTKNSVTTTVTPTTLAQGELAVNITDKKMWVGNAATTPVQILGAGATNRAGGSNTQVQYNSSGDLAGSANMVFDGSTLTTLNSAYTGTLTGGTGVVNLGSGQFYKDASGNVGIGITNPTNILVVAGAATANADARATITSTDTTAFAAGVGGGITFKAKYNSAGAYFDAANIKGIKENGTDGNFAGALVFSTHVNGGSPTERMRIDASGNLFVGGTTQRNGTRATIEQSGNLLGLSCSNNTASVDFAIFYANAGTICGAISRVGTTSAVVYTATSDYRLKTVIGSVTNAGQRIDALQPIEYDWNTGGRTRGFLAHQFAEIYPNSVSGEKDALDADGKPVYQGMQASSSEVMADLIAEIQSLRKRVAQLESK